MTVSIRKNASYFTTVSVRRDATEHHKGVITAGNRQFSCALGRSHITTRKREGDGATPAGEYQFLSAFYRADREILRPCGLGLTAIGENLGWCDAPDDRNYNRAVRLPYGANCENMWRDDHLYDWIMVLDQNFSNRMRNLGSAIFFHVAAPGYTPTEGCVAVGISDMRWLVGHIGNSTRLVIEA